MYKTKDEGKDKKTIKDKTKGMVTDKTEDMIRTKVRGRTRANAKAMIKVRARARAWPWTKLRARIRTNERSRHGQRICKHMRRQGNEMQPMDKTRKRAITKQGNSKGRGSASH